VCTVYGKDKQKLIPQARYVGWFQNYRHGIGTNGGCDEYAGEWGTVVENASSC
jgi:hypothetical protein